MANDSTRNLLPSQLGDLISVGDVVMWKGSWGTQPAKPARIERMELCKGVREKYGIVVESAWVSDKNRLCVTLDNGSWAYGFQIEPIKGGA